MSVPLISDQSLEKKILLLYVGGGQVHGLLELFSLLFQPVESSARIGGLQSFLRRARNGFSSTCTVSRTTSKAST